MESPTAPLTPAQRFAAQLEEFEDWPVRMGLAVSGGPDSLALMLLAHDARPGGFEVASVDHGLRPESAAEAALVAGLCAERGIAHRTLRCAVDPHGNLQANARTARYRALAQWAGERRLQALVTAHHLDDQAETLLMRLNRGAGVRGLAGMRPCTIIPDSEGGWNLPLWRPLLGWRKAELASVVLAAGILPVRDPTNTDPRFERTAARALLAASPWLDPRRLAESAAHLADAEDAIERLTYFVWETRVSETGDGYDYNPDLEGEAIELRIVERIVELMGSEGRARGKEIARLCETLRWEGTATLAGVKATARGTGEVWRFTRAPPRRSQ